MAITDPRKCKVRNVESHLVVERDTHAAAAMSRLMRLDIRPPPQHAISFEVCRLMSINRTGRDPDEGIKRFEQNVESIMPRDLVAAAVVLETQIKQLLLAVG